MSYYPGRLWQDPTHIQVKYIGYMYAHLYNLFEVRKIPITPAPLMLADPLAGQSLQ